MARHIPQVVEADPGSREARVLAVAAQQADDLKPGPGTYETQSLRGITSGLQAAAGRPSAAFGCQVVPQDRFSRRARCVPRHRLKPLQSAAANR